MLRANANARCPVHSLQKYCVFTLIQYRKYLGDVGYVEPNALREVLAHCTVDELAHVEDATKEGSNRDLTWYTWHLWQKHYQDAFPNPSKIVPLRGPQPVDYTVPAGLVQPGNWRRMYFQAQKDKEEKLKQMSGKLRNLYAAENVEKDSRKVQAVLSKPLAPFKRGFSGTAHIPLLKKPKLGGSDSQKMRRTLGVDMSGPRVSRTVEVILPAPRAASVPCKAPAKPIQQQTALGRARYGQPAPRPQSLSADDIFSALGTGGKTSGDRRMTYQSPQKTSNLQYSSEGKTTSAMLRQGPPSSTVRSNPKPNNTAQYQRR